MFSARSIRRPPAFAPLRPGGRRVACVVASRSLGWWRWITLKIGRSEGSGSHAASRLEWGISVKGSHELGDSLAFGVEHGMRLVDALGRNPAEGPSGMVSSARRRSLVACEVFSRRGAAPLQDAPLRPEGRPSCLCSLAVLLYESQTPSPLGLDNSKYINMRK